ncbi:MAG: hypothetical protein EKK47_07425 [Burkholderiales bacterium]|jgi:hypothetical protein|nr:MAG: hypothetical protein EKK47_07425 [Burkholderiales bacterium]
MNVYVHIERLVVDAGQKADLPELQEMIQQSLQHALLSGAPSAAQGSDLATATHSVWGQQVAHAIHAAISKDTRGASVLRSWRSHAVPTPQDQRGSP